MYPFFVYGTLKRGGPNYARLLAGRTSAEIPARLPGAALYTAGPYPFLALEADLVRPDDTVYGTLMHLRPASYEPTLAALDDLEEYAPGRLLNLYERVALWVQAAGGPQTAWVYVAGAAMLAEIRAGQLRRVDGGRW